MEVSNREITRRQCLTLLMGAIASAQTSEFCRAENARNILRVAVSIETLAGSNINDARAAYHVWINEISRASGHVTAEVVPEIFVPSEELIRYIRQGTIDCFGATALEFAKVADLTDPDFLMIPDYLTDGMEYVLLVHNSSPFKKIADLRGAQIVSHLHHDMVVLPAWLDTMLAAFNLPVAEQFFGSLSSLPNLNQVVLPVFFRRVDGACLARRSWETAVELNPQLGHALRPLAVSPKVVPIAVGFRRNCNRDGRSTFIDSMLHISATVAGQQISALYQTHGFIVRPTSVMKSTVEMVNQFSRLSGQAGARKGKH